jgi:hypothetical protein
MPTRNAFRDPFYRNGCVPLAWAHVSDDPSTETAQALADLLVDYYGGTDCPALNRKLSAFGARKTHLETWAALAGVKVVEIFQPERRYEREQYTVRWGSYENYRHVERNRPTVAKFCRTTGAEGRWVVFVKGHAFAVIDGVEFGYYQRRARVHQAVRVVPLHEEE